MGNKYAKDLRELTEDTLITNIESVVDEKLPDFNKTLNVAVVGKVSSGKSSFLNALLRRTRETLLTKVDAQAGVTQNLHCFRLDDRVIIIDSPGLDDIVQQRSEITETFLGHIDVAILIVTGAADASQKKHYDELLRRSQRTFVVLNKIDEWDHLEESALDDVVTQWKSVLGVKRIFQTCTKGFDPRSRKDTPYDVRGVDEVRDEIEAFLRTEGKDLLFARLMGEKKSYAISIIATALFAVAGEAFLPGAHVYITVTQVVAICSLYYLYTGRSLSKGAALALIPSFMAQTVGQHLFLFVKSFFPPTGVLDAAAAGIAVVITFAMLGAVNTLLIKGEELEHNKDQLVEQFGAIRKLIEATIKAASVSDWTSLVFWKRLIEQVLYAPAK